MATRAKERKAAGRKRPPEVINDPGLPLLNGVAMESPKPPKRLSAAKQKAYNREREAWKARMWAEADARRAARLARLARRPAEMRDDGYRLPADVRAFLRTLFTPNDVRMPTGRDFIFDAVTMYDELEAAYLEGCRQGYIEGRVADLEPKRQRSAKANAAKRRKRQNCGGHMMTLDERDAAIVAEFPTLRGMLGSIEAQLRLADKYGLQSREQVGNIVRKAKRNGPA